MRRAGQFLTTTLLLEQCVRPVAFTQLGKSGVGMERGCGRSLSRRWNQAWRLVCDTAALQKSKLSANRIARSIERLRAVAHYL